MKANLPTLYNRRLHDLCILTYKGKHNLCPQTISNIFMLIVILIVYSREIFIYLDSALLRMENIQFDI